MYVRRIRNSAYRVSSMSLDTTRESGSFPSTYVLQDICFILRPWVTLLVLGRASLLHPPRPGGACTEHLHTCAIAAAFLATLVTCTSENRASTTCSLREQTLSSASHRHTSPYTLRVMLIPPPSDDVVAPASGAAERALALPSAAAAPSRCSNSKYPTPPPPPPPPPPPDVLLPWPPLPLLLLPEASLERRTAIPPDPPTAPFLAFSPPPPVAPADGVCLTGGVGEWGEACPRPPDAAAAAEAFLSEGRWLFEAGGGDDDNVDGVQDSTRALFLVVVFRELRFPGLELLDP